MNATAEVRKILAGDITDEEIEQRVREAVSKREAGERLIDEGNAQLAIWTAVARQTSGAISTTRLSEIAGLSREYIYKIQRAWGVGVSNGKGK